MMKLPTLAFILLFGANYGRAEGLKIIRGGTVENGGNTAWCPLHAQNNPGINPPADSLLGEYLMLDYAHAMQEGISPNAFTEVKDWRGSSLRLALILSKVSPNLFATFQQFVESTNQVMPSERSEAHAPIRQWVETDSYQVIDFKPEYSTCMAVLQQEIAPSIQHSILSFRGYLRTITRRQTGGFIEYEFNGPMLRYLSVHSALQVSMLFTHEWLWDHADNLETNQRANVFLHSREIERMPASEIRARLRDLGLRF